MQLGSRVMRPRLFLISHPPPLPPPLSVTQSFFSSPILHIEDVGISQSDRASGLDTKHRGQLFALLTKWRGVNSDCHKGEECENNQLVCSCIDLTKGGTCRGNDVKNTNLH